MNVIKIKAALAHIGEGFYKLADAMDDTATHPEQPELHLVAPVDTPNPTKRAKPKAKAKKVAEPKAEPTPSVSLDDLRSTLSTVTKLKLRAEATKIMDGRKLAGLSEQERVEVAAKLSKLLESAK